MKQKMLRIYYFLIKGQELLGQPNISISNVSCKNTLKFH